MIFLFFSLPSVLLKIPPNAPSDINTGYQNIITNSDSLFYRDSLIKRNIFYSIDYNSGVLRLFKKFDDTLYLKFNFLPINIVGVIQPIKVKEGIKEFKEHNLNEEKNSLRISGTNGLSFDISPSGNSLEHTLFMNISGSVHNYTINGIISDENLPEGYIVSKDIRELDKSKIEISSPNMKFSIGNLELSKDRRQMKILGINGSINALSLTIGYAGGKYSSRSFTTEEGNHGPYKISVEEENCSIVPNSDIVYLDGKRLKRGENLDYTIDYDRGELFLDAGLNIKEKSILFVEFRYKPSGFNTVYFNGGINHNGLILKANREEDISEPFTILNPLPDSGYGYVMNADFVGTGNGDYNLIDSIFYYRGYKKGTYNVYFAYVGPDKGEYEYIDSLHYFVYNPGGRWTPYKKQPLPEKKDNLEIEVNKSYGPIKIYLKSIGGYRKIHFTDITENGVSGEIKSSLDIGHMGKLNLAYYRKNGKNLGDISNTERIVMSEWGIKSRPEKIFLGNIMLNPLENLNIGVSGGYTTNRERLNFSLSYKNLGDIYADIITKYYTRYGFKIGPQNIQIIGKREEREKGRMDEIGIQSPFLTITKGWEGRFFNEEFIDTALTYIVKSRLNKGIFSLSGGILRRYLKGSKNYNQHYNFSEGIHYLHLPFSFQLNTGIKELKNFKLIPVYRRVENGEGDYSYDPETNQYFADTCGSFVREFIESDTTEETKEISSNGSFSFTGKNRIEGGYSFQKNSFVEKQNINLYSSFPITNTIKFFLSLRRNLLSEQSIFSGAISTDTKNIIAGIRMDGVINESGINLTWKKDERGYGIYERTNLLNIFKPKFEFSYIERETKIFSSKISPVFEFRKGKTSILISSSIVYNKFKGEVSVKTKTLYPEGLSFSFSPYVKIGIGSFGIYLNGSYRYFPDRPAIYNLRFGADTEIKE